jgi:hypothetical protein
MSDTFSYIAPVMPRRRVDPFALKLAVTTTVMVALLGAFAAFVISQERAADRRRAALEERVATERQAQTQALIDPASTVDAASLDIGAKSAAVDALAAAREVWLETSSLGEAGTARLAVLRPQLIFVDGLSTASTIVSVSASDVSWAAAVMGPSGACYWVRVNAEGEARYGTGRACTGEAALGATDVTW